MRNKMYVSCIKLSVYGLSCKILNNFYVFLISIIILGVVSCGDDNNVIPLPIKQAGDLILCEKIEDISIAQIAIMSLLSGIDVIPLYDVEVYSIKYYSIGKNNKQIECSGVIYVPKTLINIYGFISYQHATITNNSGIPSNTTSIEHFVPVFTTTSGYISMSNDYIGYGSSLDETHPYHIDLYNADDWYYFVKASQTAIKNKNYNVSNNLWIVGYSQGGYNAVSAMKKWESCRDNSFNLKAVFDGDGALELSTMLQEIFASGADNYVAINYGFMFIQAYNEYYNLGLKYSDIFTEKYKDIIEDLFYKAKHYNQNIGTNLPKTMKELYTENFIKSMIDGDHPIYTKLLENDLTKQFIPNHKLYMYHSINDDAIPYSNAYSAYNKFKTRGGYVEFVDSPSSLNHAETFLEFYKFVLKEIALDKN